jgi:hypothetical protein
MDTADWVLAVARFGVGALPLLGIGALALGWYLTRRPRPPVSVDRAVAAAGYDPAAPPPRPVGRWNAQVSRSSLFLAPGSGLGHVRLENGWLGFHEGGAPTPTWVVPAASVRAGKNSVLSRQEVWLEHAELGRVELTVSHESINQWMRNDLKDLRERSTADEFLWLLHHAGASVVAQ